MKIRYSNYKCYKLGYIRIQICLIDFVQLLSYLEKGSIRIEKCLGPYDKRFEAFFMLLINDNLPFQFFHIWVFASIWKIIFFLHSFTCFKKIHDIVLSRLWLPFLPNNMDCCIRSPITMADDQKICFLAKTNKSIALTERFWIHQWRLHPCHKIRFWLAQKLFYVSVAWFGFCFRPI